MIKAHKFNSVGINTDDKVLDIIFEIPTSNILDLSKYPLKEFRRHLFYFNTGIEEVILPEGVEKIDYCFVGCKNLRKINIPESIKYLDHHFLWESKLYNDPINWQDKVFYLNNWAIEFRNDSESISIKDGTEYISDEFSYIAYDMTATLKSLTLPSSLKVILDRAFNNQKLLEEITLPTGIKKIGNLAFGGCSNLKKIVFGCNLEESEDYYSGVFSESCTSATSPQLIIKKNVTKIIDYCFRDLGPVSMTLESNSQLTKIGRGAFLYSDIKNFTFPKTLTEIGPSAFSNCSNLTYLSYQGTTAQWNNIIKGSSWNYEVPATYVQCTNGQVQI